MSLPARTKLTALSAQPRTLSILGSTGSIGCSTVALAAANQDHYRVVALTAQSNAERLAEQARLLKPTLVVIGDERKYDELKQLLAGEQVEVACGQAAIVDAATRPADIVLGGIVGAAGLAPIFAAVRQGTTVAIANKEPLVCAGELIRREAQKYGATLLPVDSEHNAIFQVFDFERPELVEKIILTASGGPFRSLSLEEMRHVTTAEAVKHPNWSMGAKISVDSATMMNKGLEMIEAYQLFPVRTEQIEVLVHPESVIHSMVEYRDGSVLAQMGPSDMTIPIAYALAWPQRISTPARKLNLAEIGSLHFERPDIIRFPALRLAREVLEIRGITPIVLNAANEIAVAQFLRGTIGFLDIVPLIEKTLQRADGEFFTHNTPEDIIAIDHWARRQALALIKEI